MKVWMKREDGARDRRRDRDTYQSCLIPDVLAHLAHATRRGGRCVCVVRLLRNGSKTKFFQQPGRFQARTPFPLARPGRASRKPPGTRVTLPPRKAHDTWHSAPNHMEPPSAAPRPGLRDAAAIHVCANVYSAERRMGPPTRCYCLCLVSSHPEHQYTGWVGQIMAAASLVPPFWKAHGRHGAGNHPGLSDGLLTD